MINSEGLAMHNRALAQRLKLKPIPVDNAPETYKELVKLKPYIMDCIENHMTIEMPVYSGGSENTIYTDKWDNYKFRAIHDFIHIMYGLRFTEADECKVCDIHADMLRKHGASDYVIKLLEADVKGQVRYYYKHKKFVENQLEFIEGLMAQ